MNTPARIDNCEAKTRLILCIFGKCRPHSSCNTVELGPNVDEGLLNYRKSLGSEM